MHAAIKSSFYIIFLVLALIVGIKMLINSKGNILAMIFGLTILILGVGEGFHIVPRILEIFSSDIGTYGPMMETGRFISSISIIFVYLLLFDFWRVYYRVTNIKKAKMTFMVFAVAGVVLSVILKDSTDTLLIVLRNIPLMFIGYFVILNFKKQAALAPEKGFKFLWLALLLSLVFTVAFELLSTDIEFLVILMMPKTLMFIWIVVMGYNADKKNLLKSS